MEYLQRQEGLISDEPFEFMGSLGLSFIVTIPTQSNAGTTEVPVLLVKNPAGSGKTLRIHTLKLYTIDVTGNNNATLKIYRGPTITANGAAANIRETRTAKAVSPIALVYTAPTIGANGNLVDIFLATGNSAVAETQHLGIFLDPGENFLFTVQQSSAGVDYAVTISWSEITGLP